MIAPETVTKPWETVESSLAQLSPDGPGADELDFQGEDITDDIDRDTHCLVATSRALKAALEAVHLVQTASLMESTRCYQVVAAYAPEVRAEALAVLLRADQGAALHLRETADRAIGIIERQWDELTAMAEEMKIRAAARAPRPESSPSARRPYLRRVETPDPDAVEVELPWSAGPSVEVDGEQPPDYPLGTVEDPRLDGDEEGHSEEIPPEAVEHSSWQAEDPPRQEPLIRETVSLVVSPFGHFRELAAFCKALEGLGGVRNVRVRRFHRTSLYAMVQYEGALPLERRLADLAGFEVAVIDSRAGSIEARINRGE